MAPTRSATHKYAEFCVKKTVYDKNGVLVSRYWCTICENSIARRGDFPRHVRRHTRERLFYCKFPNCSHTEGFSQLGNLLVHHRAVHERKRQFCPHSWVKDNGEIYSCTQSYSDASGLIRHRSVHHGFDAGDDEAKIQVATPEGMKFPNSKYVRGSSKRKAVADGDDLATLPAHPSKRSRLAPAPAPPPAPTPSSSRHSSKKKSASKKSAPEREAQIEWNSPYTIPTTGPSVASPVSDWDLATGCPSNSQSPMQSQPSSSMGAGDLLVDPLAFLSCTTPAKPSNVELESLFSPEAQTALVNNWAFGSQKADFDFDFDFNFDFNFAAPAPAPLPLPTFNGNGTVDPSMLANPAPAIEKVKLANAGLTPSPGHYYWGGYPSPGSSRSSTASPDLMVFDGAMPQWVPSPDQPDFNAYCLQ